MTDVRVSKTHQPLDRSGKPGKSVFVWKEDNKILGLIILGLTSSFVARSSIYTKILLLVTQKILAF